jgi:hypothetical protein
MGKLLEEGPSEIHNIDLDWLSKQEVNGRQVSC